MSCKRSVADTYLSPAQKALTESCRFFIDYTDDLAEVSPADILQASTWTINGTVVEEDSGYTDQMAWIRVSGGTKIGNLHRLTNTVVTAGGDTFVRTLTIKIVNIQVKRPDVESVEFVEPTPLI
jgi:hypothetical protein